MQGDDGDRIRLTVPATPASARIARVAAAGLATRAGFTYREVEQFRLAVDEAAALLTDALPADPTEPAARLVVAYLLARDGLHVELAIEGGPAGTAGTGAAGAPPAAVPDLTSVLLDASIDDWDIAADGRRVRLHKRRPEVGHPDDEH